MENHLKSALLLLILVFAVFGVMGLVTNASSSLTAINPVFFALAAVFFILSVFIWVISWAVLIKKHLNLPIPRVFWVGISAVYGALTPVQIGAEALRSLRLKSLFGVSYSDSVAASMIVKGVKFLIIALAAGAVLSLLFTSVELELPLLLGLISGFLVVAVAALLFLLPLNAGMGLKISHFFGMLSERLKFFSLLEKYFISYSNYLKKISVKFFILTFALAFLSWGFEFLALQFSFFSLNVFIPLHSILFLFVLVSILERTPFLPRGIGLVEVAGYAYLSFPLISSVELLPEQIGAVLIVFGIARLVVPTIFSIAVYAVMRRTFAPGLQFPKNKQPEQAV